MTESTGNKYELMVIIDPGIGQANVQKRLESIKKTIAKHGEIFFEDIWGEKELAYPMKKASKGFYAVFGFNFEAAELKEFETGLTLEPEVIRHLVVKLPLKYEPMTLDQLKAAHQAKKDEEAAAKAK
jgi:small subunit ribosomal protein S6